MNRESIAVIKKLSVIAVAATLALTLMPATSAVAAASRGGYAGCYGIKKKGNYNDVRLAVTGLVRGRTVAAFAKQSVTYKCQRVNSIPVVTMWLDKVMLRVGRRTVASAGPRVTTSRAKVQAQTRYRTVRCGRLMHVYARFHYKYYDGSTVRPFTIHGPAFSRC
jgi:uncharacterized membrane protein